ncbi:UNKNOWN [Stylonychia lemnae]|uniref:Uncharacterized protein n=1 Tax=Stylonychia lemnae TaxID=5949 RepID=A0A077ZQ04_STYLE|nr:UNKNOWN [Stylonychia lemnae]|eukprot:CDW71544.1 UNKNOWN [Stylonychia lemnae]
MGMAKPPLSQKNIQLSQPSYNQVPSVQPPSSYHSQRSQSVHRQAQQVNQSQINGNGRPDYTSQQPRSFQNVYEMSKATDSLINQYQRNNPSRDQGFSGNQMSNLIERHNSSGMIKGSYNSEISQVGGSGYIRPSSHISNPQYDQIGNRGITPNQGVQNQYQSNRSSNQPANSDNSIYKKPINHKYEDLIMHDQQIGVNERNTALYTKFDMKNLDIRTDGSPVSYKPEYHPSKVSSDIFPNSTPNMKQQSPIKSILKQPISTQPYFVEQSSVQVSNQQLVNQRGQKMRLAQENRRKAKQDMLRKQRLRDILVHEL